MKLYQLKTSQKLSISVETAWKFFSNPANLSKITPPWLNFEVRTDLPEKMYAGMIITYFVRPLLNIPQTWVTEITHVNEPNYFVDEQRIGPYSIWHHQHKIEPIEGGVLMTDIVSYKPPFGIFGSIANSILIKKQLKEIFDFRVTAVEKMFGKME